MKRLLGSIVALSCMVACGQTLSAQPNSSDEETQNSPSKVSPDASGSKGSPENMTWVVQFKICGERNLPLPFPEKYIFKSGFLAQTVVSSDTPELQCKQALAFNRVIVSSSWSNDTYAETSQLQASQLRTVCRSKVEGAPVDPPASDVTRPASPLAIQLTLDIRRDVMNAKLMGSPQCPNGSLDLGLSKE